MNSLIGMTINFIPTTTQNDDNAPRGGLGSQVLPVANLSNDFSGIPEDGLEYLFLVRREAELQPRVNRVKNPYIIIENQEELIIEEPMSRPSELWREAFIQKFITLRERITLGPPPASYPPSSHNSIPSARDEGAWSVFIHGKRLPVPKVSATTTTLENIVQVNTMKVSEPIAMEVEEVVPIVMTLEEAKAAALASLELDAPILKTPSPTTFDSPSLTSTLSNSPTAIIYDPLHLPHTPTPAVLLEIDKPAIIHILSHFTNWFLEKNERHEALLNFVPSTTFAPMAVRRKSTTSKSSTATVVSAPKKRKPRSPLPTQQETDWILSLLLRLESLLNGDDIATLRDLARILSTLAEDSGKESEKRDLRGRDAEEKALDERDGEGRAKCWMIVAVIASVWGQRDMFYWNLA